MLSFEQLWIFSLLFSQIASKFWRLHSVIANLSYKLDWIERYPKIVAKKCCCFSDNTKGNVEKSEKQG
jgi:hypothetical protein